LAVGVFFGMDGSETVSGDEAEFTKAVHYRNRMFAVVGPHLVSVQ
jgi:hypothetical protein